jgi:mRNA interferase MazF
VVLAITSQLSHVGEYAHYEFVDWETAGLLKASLIRPMMATIEQGLIVRCPQHATTTDLSELERVLDDIRNETSNSSANA